MFIGTLLVLKYAFVRNMVNIIICLPYSSMLLPLIIVVVKYTASIILDYPSLTKHTC